MSSVAFDRQLLFDGCFNFRDLGGCSTCGGGSVRLGRVYRADGPHALTDRDAALLAGLNLATIIDLRTIEEATQRGSYSAAMPAIVEHLLSMMDVVPDLEELERWVDPAVVAQRYRQMLRDGGEAIAEVLAILSDPSAFPALIHCSAGKDRTGIVSAILLGLLGARDDTIIADYALSGPAMLRLVDHLRRIYPDTGDWLERVGPALIAAEPATMARFLEDLRTDYGSFDGLAEHLGVASATPYLRHSLLS